MKRTLALLPLLAVAGGCDAVRQPARLIPEMTTDWRRIASDTDRERLREWRSTFVGALAAARAAGHGVEITREGSFLEPDAATGGGPIPNGDYRCRVIKLGAKTAGLLDYIAYPAFACRITAEGALQRFDKVSGSQRYAGLIFPNDAMRQVFLGTLVLGDETRALQYAQDQDRNVAAYVERVGPRRWRMLMPQPRFESQMDVVELTPA